MIKFLIDYLIIKISDQFDTNYYLQVYPDVRKADINPLWHFVRTGWREGRNPSPHFYTKSYTENNPEVKKLEVNPLIHFLRNQKKLSEKSLPKNRLHKKARTSNKTIQPGYYVEDAEKRIKEIFLVFHVGDSKTGTSIIQNFLDVNRRKLFDYHHSLYPNPYSEELEMGRCHNHGEWYKYIQRDNGIQFSDYINKFIAYANSRSIDQIIFSYEGWIFDNDFLNLLRNISQQNLGFRTKIICYLRRTDYWCESAWKQWGLKTTKSFEDFIKDPVRSTRLKFVLDRLNLMTEIIGEENIIVRPYEKQQLQKGLMTDFLSFIGIDYSANHWDRTEEINVSINPGFNRDVLELLNYCHELFEDIHDNDLFDLFTTLLDERFIKQPFEAYSLLSPQERHHIYNLNLPFEKEIAARFSERESGLLFYEPLPDPEEPCEPYEGLVLKKAIPIIINLIEETNSRIDNLNKKFNE